MYSNAVLVMSVFEFCTCVLYRKLSRSFTKYEHLNILHFFPEANPNKSQKPTQMIYLHFPQIARQDKITLDLKNSPFFVNFLCGILSKGFFRSKAFLLQRRKVDGLSFVYRRQSQIKNIYMPESHTLVFRLIQSC